MGQLWWTRAGFRLSSVLCSHYLLTAESQQEGKGQTLTPLVTFLFGLGLAFLPCL